MKHIAVTLTSAVLTFSLLLAGVVGASDSRSDKTPRLKPETIQKVIRAQFGGMKKCYEAALLRDRKLTGKLTVDFTIERSGKTSEVRVGNSSIKDAAMRSCMVEVFERLRFPAPKGGTVTVGYPIVFSPN